VSVTVPPAATMAGTPSVIVAFSSLLAGSSEEVVHELAKIRELLERFAPVLEHLPLS
jgi:hypothetical protein